MKFDFCDKANFVGKKITLEKILFSFNIADKNSANCDICVEIKWDPSTLCFGTDGYLFLCGDYAYVDVSGRRISSDDLNSAREFFKKYKVLFAAVWESFIDASDVQDYFCGYISFKDLIGTMKIPPAFIVHIDSISMLEHFIRNSNFFNMND